MKAAVLALLVLLFAAAAAMAAPGTQVDVIPLNAEINPITGNYLEHGLQQAQTDHAQAAIIELDTPGGLDTSMRQMVKDMQASPVPVVVYVGPPGARAGSAGVFLTMAADVAAMAPNTNIGAAHPVDSNGGNIPSDEAMKVVNDAVAYIRSLAEHHGRNADWAEQAVRSSVSVTDQQALQQHIVDVQAADLPDLLDKLDGRTVKGVTMHTAGATVKQLDMSPFERTMNYIADPNIAYLMMLLGTYGLIFEVTSPGAIMPGVLGGLGLILGLLALGTLPVNHAGLALIAFSLLLFIADVKVASHGILTAGGIIAFLVGSLALFNTGSTGLAIALPLILLVTAATALFFSVIVRLGIRARKAVPKTGAYDMIGRVGEVQRPLQPVGQVLVNGEWWKATSDEPIDAGARVEVLGVRGLTLVVRRQ